MTAAYNPSHRLTLIKLTGIILLLTHLISCDSNPETGDFCSESIAVSVVNDLTVPESVKNAILYQPHKLMSTYVPGDISQINPKFPSGKIVVMNVATLDYPINSSLTKDAIREVIFDSSPGKMSIANYYTENSYGQFSISEGGITDWVSLETKIEDYKNENGQSYGAEGNNYFIKDILSESSFNWATMDTNKNGIIETEEAQLLIIVPLNDPNAKNIDPLRPTGWASTRPVIIGNINTKSGTYNFETRNVVYLGVKASFHPTATQDPFESKKVLAHEFGHALFNLTDRYGVNRTIGDYEIMSANNSNIWLNMNPHDKMKIGWLKPTFLAQGIATRIRFVPTETNKLSALVLLKPTASGALDTKEYWMVEFRKQTAGKFDIELPEPAGLAIYYVKEDENGGFDQIILIDHHRSDAIPQQYYYDGYFNNALFKDDEKVTRHLYDKNGAALRSVSEVHIDDDYACAKFW